MSTDPDRPQAFAVKTVLRNLRANPPGPPTDDRWTQINSFTGVVYIAVLAVARGLASASIDVLAYRPKGRKSFSVGGRVVKSQASSNGQARDEDYVPVKFAHPLAKLFRTINAQDTLGNFLTDWVIQRKLTGTAHVWTPRMAGFDKPAELWVLPTPFVQYLPPRPDMPLGGYNLLNMTPTGGGFLYQSGGACQLDGREVLRHQYKHPLYKWDGYSPLSGAGEQLDVLRAIDMARKASMDNQVDPSVLLALKGATPEECQRVAHEFAGRHGGAENQKKVMAFAAEDVGVDFPTRAAKDMDFTTGWDQMVKFGFAAMGVLPTVAGVTEAGSYAQLYAARKQFYDSTLKVEADEIGQFLTKHLAHKFYGDRFVVKLNVPPPDNEEMLDKQIDQDARNGMITVNQGLVLRGRDPVPDGDLPPQIYMKLVEQKAMPQPQPGMPGMPGGDPGMPPPQPPAGGPDQGMGGPDQGADQGAGESPEDSLVNAILAQLEDGDADGVVKKAGVWVRETGARGGVVARNTQTGNRRYGKDAERVLAAQNQQAARTDPDVHNFNPATESGGKPSLQAEREREGKDWLDRTEKNRAAAAVDSLLGRDDAPAEAQERTRQTDAANGYLPLRTPATQAERAAGKKDPADVYHDEEMGRVPRPSTADAAAGMTAVPGDEVSPGELVPVARRIPVAQRLATPENRRVIATALATPLARKWSADSQARNFFASRQWVPAVAQKHAPKVAAKLGISTERAGKLLDAMLRELAIRVHAQILNGKAVPDAEKTGVIRTKDGKGVRVRLGGKGAFERRTAPEPPKPRNKQGVGSLAPRPAKKALLKFGRALLKSL